jgi:hypothetical protein
VKVLDILEDYFMALDRLINGQPIRVDTGTKISKDAVALEAGRKKGTIKKSRPVFHDLIIAIDAAALASSKPMEKDKEKLVHAKAEAAKYRRLWEEALVREISLVKQLWSERGDWAAEKAALTGEKVTAIRGRYLIGAPAKKL